MTTKGRISREYGESYTMKEIERAFRNKQMLYRYAERGDMDGIHLIADAERALEEAEPTDIQRTAVKLYWEWGLPFRECGELLGVTPQAVSFSLDLLRVKIQKVLDRWHKETLDNKGGSV